MDWVNPGKATIGQSTRNQIMNFKKKVVYVDDHEDFVDDNKQNHIHNHFIQCTVATIPQTDRMIEMILL